MKEAIIPLNQFKEKSKETVNLDFWNNAAICWKNGNVFISPKHQRVKHIILGKLITTFHLFTKKRDQTFSSECLPFHILCNCSY